MGIYSEITTMSSTTIVLLPNPPTSISVHWCYLSKLARVMVGAKGWFSIIIILSILIAWHSIVRNSFLFSLIYSFHFFRQIWTPGFFFDSVTVYYHHYLIWCSSSLPAGQWESLQADSWVLLTYTHDSLSISKSLTQDTPGSHCNFPTPVLWSATSARDLEIKGWAKGVVIAIELFWLLICSRERAKKYIYVYMCVCMYTYIHIYTHTDIHSYAHTYMYTHIYVYFYLCHIYWKKIQFHVDMSNSIAEPQSYF